MNGAIRYAIAPYMVGHPTPFPVGCNSAAYCTVWSAITGPVSAILSVFDDLERQAARQIGVRRPQLFQDQARFLPVGVYPFRAPMPCRRLLPTGPHPRGFGIVCRYAPPATTGNKLQADND